MKTVYGIIVVVLVSLLMVSGLQNIFTQAGSNVELDERSYELIGIYDTQFQNFSDSFDAEFQASKNLTSYDPDNNNIGDDIKEYFELKDRVDQTRDTMNLAYKLPDLFFSSLPFVDENDLSLYRNVTWFLVWISIFIAIVVALGQRKLTEEG